LAHWRKGKEKLQKLKIVWVIFKNMDIRFSRTIVQEKKDPIFVSYFRRSDWRNV
jgi:hypothetical protein